MSSNSIAIPSLNSMAENKTVDLSGTTGAKLYKNTTDKKWVIKKSEKGEGGFPQVQSESVANDIYQALGIPVPRHFLDIPNKALILEYIDGKILAAATELEREKAKKELQRGFIIDALLANWDVIGLKYDNIILPADGSPAVRIDNGGSLTFRAQGGPKYFGKTVSEIDKMRNPSIAPQAAAIFEDLTDANINKQIETIIVPNYELILSLTPDEFKPIMRARMDYLIGKMVWVNEEPFKNTVTETSTPEYIHDVQKALIKFFKSGWLKNFKNENKGAGNSDQRLLKFLNKTLEDNHAIISGGFILKAIGTFVDEKSVDIDIYVPTAYTVVFRDIMSKLFDETSHITHYASPTGFFNKNGIISVTKYKREIDEEHYAEMDIVEVKDDRTPKDVVQNFDLTFCENWYDGENVFMTYPEHVKTKHGFLENHYLKLLFEGSPVLINRMKKYIGRGFRISIYNPVTKKDKNVTKNILTNTFFQKITVNANTENTVAVNANAIKANAVKANAVKANAVKANAIDNYLSMPSTYGDISNTLNSPVNTNIFTIKYTSIPKIQNVTNIYSIIPSNISSLTNFDKALILDYTGTGYFVVNKFLYDFRPYGANLSYVYKWIKRKFPIKDGETTDDYDIRMTYIYFVNLYNVIQKTPKMYDNLLKVYRGTRTWYLDTNTYRFSYIFSFSSTSLSSSEALDFDRYGKKCYIFYIHPKCSYMNIQPISSHKEEKEILLNPYHRCLYLAETIKYGNTYQHYAIFPSDLDIPYGKTYKEFMEWTDKKKSKLEHNNNSINSNSLGSYNSINNNSLDGSYNNEIFDVGKSNGGKLASCKMRKTQKKLTLHKNNRKHRRMNTHKAIKGGKSEDLPARFTDKLYTLPGKPPNKEEMEFIYNLKKLIGVQSNKKKELIVKSNVVEYD